MTFTPETDADRLSMLTALGEQVTYTPSGGVAKSVYGIFTAPYQAVNPATAQVESTDPQCVCRTSDLTGTVRGGTIVRGGTTYNILSAQPDGEGMTNLVLGEA